MSKRVLWTILLIYLIILPKVLLFKYYSYPQAFTHAMDFRLDNIGIGWHNANFIPFRTSLDYWKTDLPTAYIMKKYLSEMTAFAPLGALLALFNHRLMSWKLMVFFALAVGLVIELGQWIFHFGVFDVDQIFSYVLGASLAYMPMRLLHQATCRQSRLRHRKSPG
ncbi:MAG: VanZ family protein [Bacillus sp. (in: firmicutes)]